MDDLKLKVQKRAFPSQGRCRVHISVLQNLGLAEHDTMDVGVPETNRWVAVAVYSDSMVQPDTIRLSGEDITVLGVREGDPVTVKKAVPFTDQVRKAAKDTAGQVAVGLDEMKEKISATVAPVTKRAEDAAKDAYSRVSQELPTRDDISQAFDSAKKKIAPNVAPDDVGQLLSLVYRNHGAIRFAVVPSTATALTIAGLDLPAGIAAIAVRRGKDTLIIPDLNTELAPDDRVFLIGKEEAILAVLKEIEG